MRFSVGHKFGANFINASRAIAVAIPEHHQLSIGARSLTVVANAGQVLGSRFRNGLLLSSVERQQIRRHGMPPAMRTKDFINPNEFAAETLFADRASKPAGLPKRNQIEQPKAGEFQTQKRDGPVIHWESSPETNSPAESFASKCQPQCRHVTPSGVISEMGKRSWQFGQIIVAARRSSNTIGQLRAKIRTGTPRQIATIASFWFMTMLPEWKRFFSLSLLE